MPVSERTYTAVALEDPEGHWELHDGRLREKPSMTFRHNRYSVHLAHQLLNALDLDVYDVRVDNGRVRRTDVTFFIPDVLVLPLRFAEHLFDTADVLEAYTEPLPFVAEIWSPSTGDYDIDSKFGEYKRRGDREIWRVHPFERHVTVWTRRSDGEYDERVYEGGLVRLHGLSGIVIDLDRLFADPPRSTDIR